ncbi:MAG: NFACT family protein [Armatimonadota bacterium]
MNYDGFTLSAVICEIKEKLKNGRIQKIRQHNSFDITLEIRTPGKSHNLFFSIDSKFPRVYLTSLSHSVPQEPPNFCMLLRKYLSGTFITSIRQYKSDRIFILQSENQDNEVLSLIFELMGKHSNLILVDKNSNILGAMKHVGTSISKIRQILPGREYTLPPGTNKIDPREITEKSLVELISNSNFDLSDKNTISKWLIENISGMSPFLCEEIIQRCLMTSQLSSETLTKELITIFDIIKNDTYQPVLITDEYGKSELVYPIQSIQYPSDNQHIRLSINEALDAVYNCIVNKSELDEEISQTQIAIKRAILSRKQTLKGIEKTLSESEKSERYKQIGEILVSNQHLISKGMKKISLPDYYDPEMKNIDIELDEKLDGKENADRYFKRYRKAKDAVQTATNRKAITQDELNILESYQYQLESLTTAEDVKKLRKELISNGLLKQEIVQEKSSEQVFGGERIRRYTTPDGWEILYGETAKANDYLTQKVAKPNDMWLHSRSITGAHVVIRTQGKKQDIPKTVLNGNPRRHCAL